MKVLIIGRIPPPIGGVTIHTQRLLSFIEKDENFKVSFYNNSLANLVKAPWVLLKFKVFHLHSSNPYVRLYYALIGVILNKKSIITIHGDLGRFQSEFKNYIDKLSVKLCWRPIVLNDKSFSIAKKINSNAIKVSSFLPPIEREELKEKLSEKVERIKKEYNVVCCTNAYAMSFDRDKNEIYGILEIIEYFKRNTSVALIFSDPSGQYSEYFNNHGIVLTENILHIAEEHSFYEILSISNISIRNTTTDGDSISVKESLYLNKITLVTDVVSRPTGCVVYNPKHLHQTITEVLDNLVLLKTDGVSVNNAYQELSKLYLLN